MDGLSQEELRYREARKVTLVGSVVDLALGVAKIIVGVVGHSEALVADGVHSLSDLATDVMVLFAAKHGSRSADEDHPYGHARIETVMTVALGIALIAVAAGIAYDAVHHMFLPQLLQTPSWLVLVVAVISIVSKEAIYHYTMRTARRLRSNLLRANAWHSRSDAVSSVIVVIGVVGSMAGLTYLDAVAAAGVGFMIAKIGWDLAWHSLRELVDTALESERVAAIRDTILTVSGVRDLHFLRTRRMGGDALVDVHIQVDPHLSVSEGHQISEMVRQRVVDRIDEVSDVLVHIDPEDDRAAAACCALPLRDELMSKLRAGWGDLDAARLIDRVTLHYLHGKVDVELGLPLSAVGDLEQARAVRSELQRRSGQVREVGKVRVTFH
jgi:cation diffusion facilitator family transporter